MALPATIDPSSPAGSEARSLGDDQIRALKQAIIDIIGLPSNTAISGALFTVDATGTITGISIGVQIIDAKAIDFDDLVNPASEIWLKGTSASVRLIGSEASARDWRIVEDAGNVNIEQNTGSEGTPTWSKRLVIASTSGNLILYSGQTAVVEIDHAATANRTITIPDATDTLVGRATTDTLTNKNISAATGLSMGTNIPIQPAAVSGTPSQHGIFQENTIKGVAMVTYAAGAPTLQTASSFNVASITDGGVGLLTVTWDRDFASANYAVIAIAYTATNNLYAYVSSIAVGSCVISFVNENGAASDPSIGAAIIAMGAQ